MEGRFYEDEFPKEKDIVVVVVNKITETCAYVSLLEYNGREGMLLLSELSKRRIRSVSKLLRVGRTETCKVISADQDKAIIDLSKKSVDPEDAKKKAEQYARAKGVHGVMRHVAMTHNIAVEDLCEKVVWPLNKMPHEFQDAYEAFKKHVNEEVNIWEMVDFSQPGKDLSDIAEKLKADIEINLRRRLITHALRMRAKVDVSCFEFEGIDAIKAALAEGLRASTSDCEVKIKLISHPLFMLTCICQEKSLGMNTLDEAMEKIKKSIESAGGVFAVKSKPELVGQDEKEVADESGSDEDEDEDADSEQDETMGQLDEEAMKALAKKQLDEEDDD